ncbi:MULTISPECIES: hypothetical protein [Marinobacter]|uniref:hypothetical protein n=1 Tax=Marinobacter TaxID=2742 RepID=UPI001372B873|nr:MULTISPECIES: hypothetical protein [unclassified Marinobacter]
MSFPQMAIGGAGLVMLWAVLSGDYWVIPFALIAVEVSTGFAGSIMSYLFD